MLRWLLILSVFLIQTPVAQDARPCDRIDSGSHLLPGPMKAALATRYRSWEIRRQCPADVAPNSDLDPKQLSVTAGDYDDDGRKDYAVLLQTRRPRSDGTIVVAFLTSLGEAPVLAGHGSLYITTHKKGEEAHDFYWERDFRFPRDAVFTGDFHCCGDSLLFSRGRFIRIPTSD